MILLDTHAILWLDAGIELSSLARERIEGERLAGGLLVSTVSAWEIGTLVRKGRIRLDLEPAAWMQRFLAAAGLRCLPLSLDAALGASSLPEPLHGDPADRLLIATARELGVPLMTRDRLIHDYAAASGTIRVHPC
ncbi:pilT protein domain protein [Azospirillum sp. B510]|uniref:type II toxin-antitoxin system VapC family toxin n=1 Tax=Azospirillum sp. (strain B510) TaxID=137722 RepID=UPI0001C4BD14|nr:type II toxin-antitoxin system VapC family toxin [Azospirillum sp. B510]BAI72141.1 pilT protein domain protein [Azospirillum sp. B510]